MRCNEFADRVDFLLDRRIPPESDAALRAHAAGCEPCRRQLLAWQSLEQGLAESVPESPDHDLGRRVLGGRDLGRRVLAALGSTQVNSARKPASWRVLAALSVSAAAVAIALVLVPMGLREPAPHLATIDLQAIEAKREKLPPAQMLPSTAADANAIPTATPSTAMPSASVSASAAALAELGQAMIDLPSVGYLATLGDVEFDLGPATLLTPMSGGLKPVADSVRGAIDLLRQVLPQQQVDSMGRSMRPPGAES